MSLRTFHCLYCGNIIYASTYSERIYGSRKRQTREGQFGHSDECVYYRLPRELPTAERTAVDMGMFDKDKVFAPDGPLASWVDDEQDFILRDIEVVGEVDTPDGPTDTAPMVHLKVSALDSADTVKTVSWVGDIAAKKAGEKDEGDLPAIVRMKHVESSIPNGNDAYVLQFVDEYKAPTAPKAKA